MSGKPVGWAQCPKYYLPKRDCTIQLGFTKVEMRNVIEFNSWDGDPEDSAEVERTRYTALLDDDGHALLAIYRGLLGGDAKLLNALFLYIDLGKANPAYQVTLSYDLRLGTPVFRLDTIDGVDPLLK